MGCAGRLAGVECSRNENDRYGAPDAAKRQARIARTAVDPLTLISEVVSATAIEARLRGVRVDSSWPRR